MTEFNLKYSLEEIKKKQENDDEKLTQKMIDYLLDKVYKNGSYSANESEFERGDIFYKALLYLKDKGFKVYGVKYQEGIRYSVNVK